jgi:adenylate cyclase
LQFLGDTGNLAAKLEAETKRFDCVLIASEAAALVAPNQRGVATFALSIPGKEDDVQVTMLRTRRELDKLLRPAAED